MQKLSNKFIIIIPTFNVEGYILECLESILNQDLNDVGIIIRDDISTDNTKNVIKNFLNISKEIEKLRYNTKDILYIENSKKLYPCGNTHESVINYVDNDNSIIGVVDGDDKLLDTSALTKVYNLYQNGKFWLVWSQHKCSTGNPGFSKSLPSDEQIYFNRGYWSVSHFRTSIAKLYKKLNPNDLKDPFIKNSYYSYCGDAAFLFPFIEMCGNEKSFFLNEVLYQYNDNLPNNEHNKNVKEAVKYGNYIRNNGVKYKKLTEL